eukprot:3264509-Alexandrium_andersonii.AAC.1
MCTSACVQAWAHERACARSPMRASHARTPTHAQHKCGCLRQLVGNRARPHRHAAARELAHKEALTHRHKQ